MPERGDWDDGISKMVLHCSYQYSWVEEPMASDALHSDECGAASETVGLRQRKMFETFLHEQWKQAISKAAKKVERCA